MLKQAFSTINNTVQMTLLGLLKMYRLTISPWVGDCCRFYPSCSAYAHGAIQQFGITKGLWLTLWRLLRCHPFSKGGIDLVPSSKPHKNKK